VSGGLSSHRAKVPVTRTVPTVPVSAPPVYTGPEISRSPQDGEGVRAAGGLGGQETASGDSAVARSSPLRRVLVPPW